MVCGDLGSVVFVLKDILSMSIFSPSVQMPVATKVLRVAFSIYFLFAISVTGFQLVLEYFNEKNKVVDEITSIKVVFIDVLANAMWSFDENQIASALSGIKKNDAALGAMIVDSEGEFLAGLGVIRDTKGNILNIKSDGSKQDVAEHYSGMVELYEFEFPVKYTFGEKSETIGLCKIFSSSGIVFDRAKYTIMLTFALALVKTSALWIIFYFTLNIMIARPLRTIHAAVTDIAEGEGDLTQKIDFHDNSELGALSEGVNKFILNLHGFIVQLVSCSSEMHKISHTSAMVSKQSQISSKSQLHALETIFSRINEMSSSASVINENVKNISGEIHSAYTEAKNTGGAIQSSVTEFKALADNVEKTSRLVQKLSDESDSIDAIVDTIQSIAEQTNLLALNAAIEAARAGESGRGFAVVADEVRTLAARTQGATNEIKEIIGRVQDTTTEVASEMISNCNNAQHSSSLADQIGGSFSVILESIDNANNMVNEIDSSANIQYKVSKELNTIVEDASAITRESSTQVDETVERCRELRAIADDLQVLMNRFKV